MTQFIVIFLCSCTLKADIFQGTLKEFVAEVAMINSTNIVIDEPLDDEIEVFITEEPKQSLIVLKDLLDERGLYLYKKGNFYLVRKIETKAPDKLHIFTTNQDAFQLQSKIEPILDSLFLPKKPKENTDTNSSNLFTQRDDSPKLKKYQLKAVNNKTLVLTYIDNKVLQFTKKILKKCDTQKKEILLVANILEVETSLLKEIGINYEFNQNILLTASVKAFLKANIKRNKIHFLSTPKLAILEGEEAETTNLTNYPIIDYEGIQENNYRTREITKYKNIQIGSLFKAKFVKFLKNKYLLNINYKKQDFVDYINDGQIIFNTTEIKNKILIAPGDTLIITGVSSIKKVKGEIGIPLLKDLPFIGDLFKMKNRQFDNKTILMTLTLAEANQNPLTNPLTDLKNTLQNEIHNIDISFNQPVQDTQEIIKNRILKQ